MFLEEPHWAKPDAFKAACPGEHLLHSPWFQRVPAGPILAFLPASLQGLSVTPRDCVTKAGICVYCCAIRTAVFFDTPRVKRLTSI